MIKENDVIINAIKDFLEQQKIKDKFIIPYHKKELKSDKAKEHAFDFKTYN